MKKILAFVLAMLMVLSMAPVMAESTVTNMWGWEVPEETIKFTAYVGSSNPDDLAEDWAMMHDYLVENFNVDITLQVLKKWTNASVVHSVRLYVPIVLLL